MSKQVTFLLFIFIFIFSLVVFAQEKHFYEPAQFKSGPESLKNRIKFPEVNNDLDISINCLAYISQSGRFQRNFCLFDKESDTDFIRNINKAVKGHKIKPARVDGDKRTVYIQYRVQFISFIGIKLINIYPNHGHNSDLYGLEYIAPQGYGRLGWGDRTTKTLICNRRRVNYLVAMIIDKNGIPSDINFIDDNVRKPCETVILNSINKSSFIPASHKGKPVNARYVDVFFNERGIYSD